MKARELRELSTEEVKEKLSEMEEELFNLRFQAKMGQLSNPLRMRIVKRDRARVKTILTQQAKQSVSNAK
jgi:large subunit ribosomal protein L29